MALPSIRFALVPGLCAMALTVYAGVLLDAQSQTVVLSLLGGAAAALAGCARLGWLGRLRATLRERQTLFAGLLLAGVLLLSLYFRSDPFGLFLIATILVYFLTCLGLNIQFGYCGVVNFSGAAFFGVGSYVAALLAKTPIPHLLLLPLGGLAATLVGLVLIVPVLKTRGHYASVVTIAFALLFKTFLEATDSVGGPQGLKVPAFSLLGWSFSKDIVLFGLRGNFYLNYILLLLVLVAVGVLLVRRLEQSWIGLSMDAVRLDETVCACFGVNIARWKLMAYMTGNFYCGLAGAVFAMMLGFIAPANFSFGDSLILISIVLLGGMGSTWGAAVATCIVILLPEKFQSMQEYRFLLYSSLVIFILLFRPQGILPRGVRTFGLGRADA